MSRPLTKEQKIEFLIKRLGDRLTKDYLLTRSDTFIEQLFLVESNRDERELEEMMFA